MHRTLGAVCKIRKKQNKPAVVSQDVWFLGMRYLLLKARLL
jgi:hypothetical protein